jgi:hypothetical protein
MVKTFLTSGLEFESQWTNPIARIVSLYPFITLCLECVATTPFKVVATHSKQSVIKGYEAGQETTNAKSQQCWPSTPISISYTITKTKSVRSTGIRTPVLRSETFSPWTTVRLRIWTLQLHINLGSKGVTFKNRRRYTFKG